MEVAGLVLAVLPILVNGLTGLARAAGTIGTLRRPSREYGRYGLFLKQQLALYQDTLTELLGGIVQDEDDLKAMIQDPNHDLWTCDAYDRALRQRLGNSYDTFLATVDQVEDELQTFVEKLNLKEGGYGQTGQDEEFYKKELRRFKMAFNKDAYTELYKSIDDLNKFLSTTTQTNIRIEEKRRKGKTSTKHAAKVRQIREHARRIHRSVVATKMCWACSCKHQVMLRIRPSHKDAEPFPHLWRMDVNEPRLHRWHLLELYPEEPTAGHASPTVLANVSPNQRGPMKGKKAVKWQLPNQPPTPCAVAQIQMSALSLTAVRIDDLCSTLMSQSSPTKGEIGFLESKDEPWRCKVHYKKVETHPGLETLSQLLSRNALKSSAANAVFSKRERLAAAATLAYSVLFLDGSWLRPIWNSKDIVLLKDVDTVTDRYGTSHAIHELAFSWVVRDPQNATIIDPESEEKKLKLKMSRKSAVLFALSLSLIELSLGEPIEDLKTDSEKAMGFVWGDIAAADRLLQHVHDTSGFEYREVVRRCLDCPFDVQNPTMDNEAFLGIYFDEIARPLMTDYEQFIGLK